jgi:maltose phosphorylase
MNQDYIKPDNWSIIEEGFDAESVKSSESLFSIGNGAMGQLILKNTGDTFQEVILQEYTIRIKLKWDGGKMAILRYFAKVLNAPNWIGIDIEINGESLDLNTCTAR